MKNERFLPLLWLVKYLEFGWVWKFVSTHHNFYPPPTTTPPSTTTPTTTHTTPPTPGSYHHQQKTKTNEKQCSNIPLTMWSLGTLQSWMQILNALCDLVSPMARLLKNGIMKFNSGKKKWCVKLSFTVQNIFASVIWIRCVGYRVCGLT